MVKSEKESARQTSGGKASDRDGRWGHSKCKGPEAGTDPCLKRRQAVEDGAEPMEGKRTGHEMRRGRDPEGLVACADILLGTMGASKG